MARRDSLVKRKRKSIYENSRYVKRKIPMSPISAYAVIDRCHAQQLASDLGYNVCRYSVSYIARYNGVIFIGPFCHTSLVVLLKFHRAYPNKRIIIWWVGSDVANAIDPSYDIRIPKRITQNHLCVSVGLQKELESIGIDADIVTLIPEVKRYQIEPLPEHYTVAVYIPNINTPLYKWKECTSIMENTPDTRYIVYGNKKPIKDVPDNCSVAGWVNNTTRILRSSSCLLRLTVHDGFPKSIIEAILMGRCVITNHEYPYITQSDNIVDTINSKPVLDSNAANYYRETYTKEKLISKVEKAWLKKCQ